jgi:hypothetical protein
MTGLAFIPFFVYYNIFNIKEVYEVTTPIWAGLLIIWGTITMTNIAGIILMSPVGDVVRSSFSASWSMNYTDASDVDRLQYSKALRSSS